MRTISIYKGHKEENHYDTMLEAFQKAKLDTYENEAYKVEIYDNHGELIAEEYRPKNDGCIHMMEYVE